MNNRYTIQRELGQGGMAIVYLAEDTRLQSLVALKVLRKELAIDNHINKRFVSEARSMFRMAHPNIIKVIDLIDEADTVAIVMEYVEGETLKQYIERKGKLNDNEIKDMLSQMLDAIEYVHEQGLVHRDIKPSNFMITPNGKVKLMDFGIAKQTNPNASDYTSTGTQQQMGTPMYMSPEQVHETKNVTYQSDIYSLGVVLWQMVSGQKPYDTKTLSRFQLESKIVNEPLAKTQSLWDEIIQKATAKEIKLRHASVNAFKNALNSNNNNKVEADVTILDSNLDKQPSIVSSDNKEKRTLRNLFSLNSSPEKVITRKKYILRIFFTILLVFGIWLFLGSVAILYNRFETIPQGNLEDDFALGIIIIGFFFGVISLVASRLTNKSFFNPKLFLIPVILISFSIVVLSILNIEYSIAIKPFKKHVFYREWDSYYINKLDKSIYYFEMEFLNGNIDIAYLDSIVNVYGTPPWVNKTDITSLTGKLAIEWADIPSGSFKMGSFDSEQDHGADENRHEVKLDGFKMSKYEVTFDQYDVFCTATGRRKPADDGFGRGNNPVINVSWEDAKAFADWAGAALPTEAQWEYACRADADNSTPFSTGNCLSVIDANYNTNYAYFNCVNPPQQNKQKILPVGSYPSNSWGLFDMHGNVSEWCADWYSDYGYSFTQNPTGPESGDKRVNRGGSWNSNARNCRSASRFSFAPSYSDKYMGFRLVSSN
jgi:serine/threonine protein kinase